MVTDFVYKYQYDLFFRTKNKVILLEFIFALTILVSIGFALTHQYAGLTKTPYDAMEKTLRLIHGGDVFITIGIILTIVLFFGYIIAHIALKPTRDALSSQKQFIGNVAHELRTPLAIIKTNIEVALLEGKLDARLRNTLLDNVDELDRTGDIINNLLSLNTLLNPEHVELSNVDLGLIVDTVIEKLAPLAKQKNITLSVKKSEFLLVWGNAVALEQIAVNLIRNAIIYTPKSGAVHITLTPNYRGSIEMQIEDNGMGITRKDLYHIFEPFYRGDKSRARAHGGSGLGLTIVSELVKLHRGKIVMQSSEKKGTTAIVTLPCGHIERKPLTHNETPHEEVAMDYSHHKHPARSDKK